MSQKNVEIVRQPVSLRDRPGRGPEERIYLRVPLVVRAVNRAAWRLPPTAWLRKEFLRRATLSGFDALNRGDFKASFMLYRPDVVFITPPRLVGLGFDPVYRGPEQRREFQKGWVAEWGEMRFGPEELLDLGNRLLYLGRVKGSGVTSGAGFESDWACLLDVEDAQIVREEPFFDREEAFEAVGLRE